MQITVYS